MRALGGRQGAMHAIDVPFVFDNVHLAAHVTGGEPAAVRLAARMSDARIASAWTGRPGHADLPAWPAYSLVDRPAMAFDAVCRVVPDPDRPVREAIAEIIGT